MPKIILIQHCQSEHHITNMSGGWTDSKLTPFGCEQAKKNRYMFKTKNNS